MPSCVVRTCKNNSMDYKKDSGITFHKFPKDMNWKYKWTRVICESRHQDIWLPSQFSVVCSAHFAEGDIYVTPGGNRRIVKNAIPTLKLYELVPRKKKCEINTIVENVTVSVQTSIEGLTKEEESFCNQIITSDCERPTVHSGGHVESIIIKVEPEELIQSKYEELTVRNEPQIDNRVGNVIITVEPKESNTKQSSIDITVDPLSSQQNNINFSNDIPDLVDSCKHKQELEKKNRQINLYRKKIKILNQTVNRLRKRTRKFEDVMDEIKYKKLIDKDIMAKLIKHAGYC